MFFSDRPENYGKPWARDELILAFELYCRIPFRKTKATNPRVVELAGRLRRSPAAVARKLGNFGAFDPELRRRNVSGLAHGSQLDREVWDAFHHDWNALVLEAHRLKHELASPTQGLATPVMPTGPSERVALVKQRIHQAFFRDAVLSNYENRCCVTGINVPECLIASHILPWSRDDRFRTDPTNGLCLSATFDRLFDAGLITVSAELAVRVSTKVLASGNAQVSRLISSYDGRPILTPHRFLPSLAHLEWHQSNVFVP